MRVIFSKSFLKSEAVKRFVRKSQLDEFKRKILEHLDRLEAEERKKAKKSAGALCNTERMEKAGYPVGTVREWKGKKYMKVAPNKWKRKYEKEERGTKLSIAAIKRKANACTTGDELLDIVLENRDRFKDENGHDLPIVKELMDYVSEARGKLSGGAKAAGDKADGGKKAKGKKGAVESGKQASDGGKGEKPAVARSPGITAIRARYESSPSAEGNIKTVVLADGGKVKCRFKVVEADAPAASHDETTFSPTAGFPTNEEGKNINDRDYQHDRDAQESVRRIAAGFNALALGDPPIVTKDGIVISGNNRTMSSKIAARNGTDGEYLQSLREMADEFGLEAGDLDGFKHPRLILEVIAEHEGDYTTEEFAAFNRDTKKTMNNVEKAVKITKTLDREKIKGIADCLDGYETMGELYQDRKGGVKLVQSLVSAGIILENEKAQYLTSDGLLNDTGKDFAETVLVGSVLNEENIRACDGAGGKSIRKKLVRAILPLIENKGNGNEYSFNAELNEAVRIAVAVNKRHDEFGTVKDYLNQLSLFEEKKIDEATGRLAEIIHDDTEKAFAARMKSLGAGLRDSAEGTQDIFLGGVETKEELMGRFLEIKKAVSEALRRAFGFLKKSA